MMQYDSERNYWDTVKQCLESLHGLPRNVVLARVRKYRQRIEALNIESDIYHDEPYDVACEIAGVDSKRRSDWDLYQEIRAHYFLSTEPVALQLRRREVTSPRIGSAKSEAANYSEMLSNQKVASRKSDALKKATKSSEVSNTSGRVASKKAAGGSRKLRKKN